MSKIPKGTQFIEAGCGEKGFRKFEKGCWWFFEGFWRHVDWKMGSLTPVTEHPDYAVPATPWTGEGLPPVGAVCEVVSPGYSNDRFDRFVGQAVTVIAHDVIDSAPVAVFRMPVNGHADEQDYHALIAKCFRPARTPEQIAADERKAEIDAMYRIFYDAPGLASQEGIAALYDAGYRKQVAP